MTRTLLFIPVAVVACGPATVIPSDDSSSTGAGDSAASVETTAAATTTTAVDSSAGDPSTTIGPVTEGNPDDDGTVFIGPSDDDGDQFECDIWVDDCPLGQKCMPWANDGGGSWNAWKCMPIAEDPKGLGEACTVEDSPASGIDDCAAGSMCWNVEPDTLVGECVAFCMGNEASPTCGDLCSHCAISADGVLLLCLPTCDPLAQNCNEGEGCYPVEETFACAPDVSQEDGALGDPCEFINVCDPGLFCALPGDVPDAIMPDCDGALGCCVPFCDPTAADPCPYPGFETAECVPWFGDGQLPPCYSGVIGACVLPP